MTSTTLRRFVASLLLALFLTAAAAAPAMANDSRASVRGSIYGGRLDAQPDVGWIAAVRAHPRTDPRDGYQRQFCAGSLIASQWVLTAAHCVVSEEGVRAPETLDVLLGEKNLNAEDTRGGEVVDVAEVIVNPAYDPERSCWDAALLRLARPVDIPPVTLIRPTQNRLWRPGTLAYIAGWGDREPFSSPRTNFPVELYSGSIPVVSDRRCRRAQRQFYRPAMFCAGYGRGRPDTCMGDSGGPIAVPRRGIWRLIGVTSFGRCGTRLEFGIYTRLASSTLQEWIAGTMAGSGSAFTPGGP